MSTIKATPSDGLCYSPTKDLYWDQAALSKEIDRVFDVCHGCRLCFNLCPSFPSLFDALDAQEGEPDVRKLSDAVRDEVVDGCFQCKLCYVKCPYTPDDGHEFQLDFPRLMLRYTAQKAKREGVSIRDKFLGNPVALGKLSSKAAPIVNTMNKARAHRALMEKTLGIHRDKLLPEFASEPFEKWVKKRASKSGPPGRPATREAVLFHTCYVNYNAPEIGKDAVEVLERSGVRVLSPAQTCCGMPALDGGDIDFATKQARKNVETLKPFVERGLPVLVVNPTCSYMLKKEYADIVGDDLVEDAKKLAAATRDLGEYLFELKREGVLNADFKSSPGEVAYHVPCHLKAQNIGFRSRDALKAIPGVKVRVVDRCCGHDGTWAMKKEHFEDSMKIGKPAFEEMKEGGQMATDCPLAAVQFEQATGERPLHPVQILARAYRENGFAPLTPSEKKEDKES
jgi:glycerol-3-phosphate dehydrogenase subunit C